MKHWYVVSLFLSILTLFLPRALLAGDVGTFRWEKTAESATLYEGEQVVFTYWYAFVDHSPLVPENEPRRFAGSYIYPLYGLDGENLTDNAPKDHYHHHGVFWTWPGVFVHDSDGKTRQYDLWTSNAKIRQRFVKFHTLEANDEQATFAVENGWYVGDGSLLPDEIIDASKTGEAIAENERAYGEKIMKEFVTIRVRHPDVDGDAVNSRAIDFELTLIPTEKPVSLQGAEKKSYGGLTIRFRPSDGKIGEERFITTDEGVAKDDMPEKPLRWADYTSKFGRRDSKGEAALSGAAIFLHPSFPDFPPTWLTRYYGPLCVGFPGVEAKRFEPGEEVVMKARIWIHRDLVAPDVLRDVYEQWTRSE